jgi:regulator of extracellular matrix RemA (YlzA/DUF370 family)
MFLHIGENEIIANDSMIGIFSAELFPRNKNNRSVENQARRESRWYKISRKKDRSVILTDKNEFILSPISVSTLRKRAENVALNF